jgi:uncharacterized protein YcbX
LRLLRLKTNETKNVQPQTMRREVSPTFRLLSRDSVKPKRLGSVELKCEIPTARCRMTTHAQKGLSKDPSVVRSIVRDADQNLGVYASVITVGKVSEGDRVEIV